MARRTRSLVAGAALLALVVPSVAVAADPTVTVRVEGTTDTLLARTTVPLAGAPVVRDGNSCSARQRRRRARTRHRRRLGRHLERRLLRLGARRQINGESHSFGAAAYWGFFLNEAVANLGICRQKVQAGDRLAVRARAVELRPDRRADARGRSGDGRARRAVHGDGEAHRDRLRPAAGLPAARGDAAASPARPSRCRAARPRPPAPTARRRSRCRRRGRRQRLRAVKAGDVRSAAEPVCVDRRGTDGARAARSPRPRRPRRRGGRRTRSRAARAVAACGRAGLHPPAPLRARCRARVRPTPSGLKDVLLRLTRRSGRRCRRIDGRRERWVRASALRDRGRRWFSDRRPRRLVLPPAVALTAGRVRPRRPHRRRRRERHPRRRPRDRPGAAAHARRLHVR